MGWTKKQKRVAWGVGGVAVAGALAYGAVLLVQSATKKVASGAVTSVANAALCPNCDQPIAQLAQCQQKLRDANALLTASSGFIGRAVGAPAGLGERIGQFLSTAQAVDLP